MPFHITSHRGRPLSEDETHTSNWRETKVSVDGTYKGGSSITIEDGWFEVMIDGITGDEVVKTIIEKSGYERPQQINVCSFCGLDESIVKALQGKAIKLVASTYRRAFICDECVDRCTELLTKQKETRPEVAEIWK
jgi:hypothetical protein